ncbi:hypothetical protein [Salisaeta longa]|uniref:hypothetical protein n=1 Tax=Salisaeta longa TaxID=503170 RepID=UPI0003B4791F|nr:hypothetical protein [Salisaeta longa]
MPRLRHVVGLMVVVLLASGCDRQRATTSAYRRIVGTWRIQTMRVDGFDYTSLLTERYNRLRLQLATDPSRFQWTSAGGLQLAGTVLLQNTRTMVWSGGFSKPVYWRYEKTTFGVVLETAGVAAGADALTERLAPSIGATTRSTIVLRLERP